MEGYLNFNKEELVNLEYSLKREILCTNRAGGYLSTTLVCCNTRKYHGLFIHPLDRFEGKTFVLLSSLDESITQNNTTFNLGIHRYPGLYEPKGNKYLVDFKYDPVPTFIYKIGGILLKKEFLFVHNEPQLMIRYTLLNAHSQTSIRLQPFLSFRNRHELSRANFDINTEYKKIDSGIASKLYEGFPYLYMQINKQNDFTSNPDWYYNIEYLEEKERGYDYQEDLFVPGHFEFLIEKGESVIFSASLKEEKWAYLDSLFEKEILIRPPKDNFINCLKNAASQFFVQNNDDYEICAGYPWFGRWGRDTFISLPGLTLSLNYFPNLCKKVLDTLSKELYKGLFPNIGKHKNAAYNSIDAPLWYFWVLQKYLDEIKDPAIIWNDYSEKMIEIIESLSSGIHEGIVMHNNGLLWTEQKGKALTWMDAIVDGEPVTPRYGYVVEINALWYNAIQFLLELAIKNESWELINKWKKIPFIIEENFTKIFWNEERKFLADYVNENGQNLHIRSNQIIAASLPYSLANDRIKKYVIKIIKQELLTKKGLRTLSPNSAKYKGLYKGNQKERDSAYHQGTVWVWQLSHYVEANFKLFGSSFCEEAEKIAYNFEEDMTTYGICSIAEVYDGNPPHFPGGSVSQAWSVSEILRILKLIEIYRAIE